MSIPSKEWLVKRGIRWGARHTRTPPKGHCRIDGRPHECICNHFNLQRASLLNTIRTVVLVGRRNSGSIPTLPVGLFVALGLPPRHSKSNQTSSVANIWMASTMVVAAAVVVVVVIERHLLWCGGCCGFRVLYILKVNLLNASIDRASVLVVGVQQRKPGP